MRLTTWLAGVALSIALGCGCGASGGVASSSAPGPAQAAPARAVPKAPAAVPEARAGALAVAPATPANLLPAAPKLSTFAPSSDLVRQADYYLGRLKESLDSDSEYKEDQEKITKDGNTLILIALALGLDDGHNKYKAAAPGLMKAGQEAAKAKTYAAAKAALADAHKAIASPPAGGPALSWDKASASLPELMKQVPLINARLKRNLKNAKRFAQKAKDSAGDTATLAVIAQGSMGAVAQTKKPTEAAKWFAFCGEMRDAAAGVNQAIHSGDPKATEKAMKPLAESCDNCHTVFNPEQVGKPDAEGKAE